jgi:predicted DNA-binding transcriptional regulator AlpA
MQTSTQEPLSRAPRSTKKPATAPALLNEGQVADLLGVSRRQVHNLRSQEWFPSAIELGPRALRWYRDELLAAVAARAPRVTKKEEPQQLAEARAERRVFRDGKQLAATV